MLLQSILLLVLYASIALVSASDYDKCYDDVIGDEVMASGCFAEYSLLTKDGGCWEVQRQIKKIATNSTTYPEQHPELNGCYQKGSSITCQCTGTSCTHDDKFSKQLLLKFAMELPEQCIKSYSNSVEKLFPSQPDFEEVTQPAKTGRRQIDQNTGVKYELCDVDYEDLLVETCLRINKAKSSNGCFTLTGFKETNGRNETNPIVPSGNGCSLTDSATVTCQCTGDKCNVDKEYARTLLKRLVHEVSENCKDALDKSIDKIQPARKQTAPKTTPKGRYIVTRRYPKTTTTRKTTIYKTDPTKPPKTTTTRRTTSYKTNPTRPPKTTTSRRTTVYKTESTSTPTTTTTTPPPPPPRTPTTTTTTTTTTPTTTTTTLPPVPPTTTTTTTRQPTTTTTTHPLTTTTRPPLPETTTTTTTTTTTPPLPPTRSTTTTTTTRPPVPPTKPTWTPSTINTRTSTTPRTTTIVPTTITNKHLPVWSNGTVFPPIHRPHPTTPAPYGYVYCWNSIRGIYELGKSCHVLFEIQVENCTNVRTAHAEPTNETVSYGCFYSEEVNTISCTCHTQQCTQNTEFIMLRDLRNKLQKYEQMECVGKANKEIEKRFVCKDCQQLFSEALVTIVSGTHCHKNEYCHEKTSIQRLFEKQKAVCDVNSTKLIKQELNKYQSPNYIPSKQVVDKVEEDIKMIWESIHCNEGIRKLNHSRLTSLMDDFTKELRLPECLIKLPIGQKKLKAKHT